MAINHARQSSFDQQNSKRRSTQVPLKSENSLKQVDLQIKPAQNQIRNNVGIAQSPQKTENVKQRRFSENRQLLGQNHETDFLKRSRSSDVVGKNLKKNSAQTSYIIPLRVKNISTEREIPLRSRGKSVNSSDSEKQSTRTDQSRQAYRKL